MTIKTPFYDPQKSYEENFEKGPFGGFADKEVIVSKKKPDYTFLGFPVHLPFGIAAGPLVNRNFTKAALNKGFDLVVYKTVRTVEQRSHAWPNVLPVEIDGDLLPEKAKKGVTSSTDYSHVTAITNSFGVPSAQPEFWVKDMKKAVDDAKTGQLVIGSFQGTSRPGNTEEEFVDDFVHAAMLVKATGAKVLEVNMSCPNEGSAHLLCFDTPKVKKIVTSIKKAIGKTPLIVKIAYFQNQAEFTNFIQEIGPHIDALSMINTIPAEVKTKRGEQSLPGNNRLISGICGSPIKWAGLDMVKRAFLLRDALNMTFSIIGVGGVMNHADYKEYREAGADAVMCATGAMWNTNLAVEIKQQEGAI